VELKPAVTEDELERVRERLLGVATRRSLAAEEVGVETAHSHVIEVRYGGEDGPDLLAVAAETGLSPERVVELHSGAEYRVAFVGFCPGFPYLVGLPRELELPRLASPRARVPAGSVAIAGAFSAIYPSATPGGWRLLGRTDATLFDFAATPPAALAPGDRVRFVPRRAES
jgi:KipI family sensor histidine kinase inhibitor